MKEILDNYYDWLKNETLIHEKNDGYIEITAPFLDNSNDYVQIYAKNENDVVTLTDDGYYIALLEASGIRIEKNRLKTITAICVSNGVKLINGAITVSFSLPKNKASNVYQENIHKMLQTILRVDDMFLTNRGRVQSYFYDDVIEFLDREDIGYSEEIAVTGKSGYINNYELLFQKSKKHNERFGKIINNLNKQSLKNIIFIWLDTQESRRKTADLVVFANDDNKMDKDALIGFDNYGVTVIPWSERNENIEVLK